MTLKPDLLRPVEAQGSLRLDTPGGRSLNLVADGDKLRLDLPGWREAREIAPRSFRSRRRTLSLLAGLLSTHGLTLSVESAGKPILLLGSGVAPSWFARITGLAPANVPFSAIRILFGRTSTN